ncbi:hypothetical protein Q7P37_005924 [Cladosporium fusiforme]
MPPLVRRRPLLERMQAYLDPWDFLLWISEELNDDAHEEILNNWATPIGVAVNFAFIVARGSSKGRDSRGSDELFGEMEGGSSLGSGWFVWIASLLVHSLTLLSCLNAFYTFFRKRHYRLFEQPVDLPPNTPSAQRVRVDSSPASASPISYVRNAFAAATASSRAYPDPEREVWEVSVWDPKPFHVTFFTLFSPGHVLLYHALLPTAPLDPRPSVTVVLAILFGSVLSLQLSLLKTSFTQQAKDNALIHGEVMNEYDTKFVHPFLTRPVRDVGTQSRESSLTPRGTKTREVDLYTPTTLVNRGFKTNPNPNYASQYDPYDLASKKPEPRPSPDRRTTPSGPSVSTPKNYVSSYTQASTALPATAATTTTSSDYSSPLKPRHERPRESRKSDAGSLGVYSHSNSPLRKATSSSHLRAEDARKAGSPLKRVSTPGGGGGSGSESYRDERRRQTGRF